MNLGKHENIRKFLFALLLILLAFILFFIAFTEFRHVKTIENNDSIDIVPACVNDNSCSIR